MPIKLTVEVPDELVDQLDALAALWSESREQFAAQSVEFCIRQGTKVEFEDDELTLEEAVDLELAREDRAAGRSIPWENVKRELERERQSKGRQGTSEAAE